MYVCKEEGVQVFVGAAAPVNMGLNGSGSKIQYDFLSFIFCGRWVKCFRGKKFGIWS
jgi:hypothetical protein